MVFVSDVAKLSKNVNKWLYQTEYKRSFGNTERKPVKTTVTKEQPEEKEHVISRYVKPDSVNSFSREEKKSNGSQKKLCSHQKKPHTSAKKKIQFSTDVIDNQYSTKLVNGDFKPSTCLAPESNIKRLTRLPPENRKERVKPIQKKNIGNDQNSWVLKPVIAGKESALYERHAFIQRKKRIKIPNSDHFVYSGTADISQDQRSNIVKNKTFKTTEPALQTKKIVAYDKNHNILRSDILRYDSDQTEQVSPVIQAYYHQQYEQAHPVDQHYIEKILSRYEKHKEKPLKEMYRSSYSLDYSSTAVSKNAPLLHAENKLVAKSIDNGNSPRENLVEKKASSFIYTKSYSPRSYETEYHNQFKKNSMNVKVDANEDFIQYYQNVLKNRPIAYLSKDDDSNEESPYKKIENVEEEKRTRNNITEHDADSFSSEDGSYRTGLMDEKQTTENFQRATNRYDEKIEKYDELSLHSSTPDIKVTVNDKVFRSNTTKNSRRRSVKTPSVSGSTVSQCSKCSCRSLSSYDPSLYSDKS